MRFDGRGNDIVLGGTAALRAELLRFLVDSSGFFIDDVGSMRQPIEACRACGAPGALTNWARGSNGMLTRTCGRRRHPTSRRLNDVRRLASLSQMIELVDRGAQEIQ